MTHLKMIFLFTCACIPMVLQAQINYVQNPSFEQYTHCPYNIDQIKFANYWTSVDSIGNPSDSEYAGHILPLCSPQYCNICDTINDIVSIPKSEAYNFYPRSGNGMVQEVMYFDDSYTTTYQREYLQGRFYNALTSGKTYCVTFYVILNQLAGYAINHIGAYIDNGMIDATQDSLDCSLPQISYTPQVLETEIIDDTMNWVKIQGNYIASGTEQYITIGNFFNDTNTEITVTNFETWLPGNNWSYYCVDDVSVIASDAVADAGPDKIIGVGDSVYIGTSDEGMPCTWYVQDSATPIGYSGGIWVKPAVTTSYVVEMDLCGNVTYDTVNVGVFPAGVAINNVQMQNVQMWPNPVSNELTISTSDKITSVVISNLIGQALSPILYTGKGGVTYEGEKAVVNVADLLPGVYFVKINDVVVKRFMKL